MIIKSLYNKANNTWNDASLTTKGRAGQCATVLLAITALALIAISVIAAYQHTSINEVYEQLMNNHTFQIALGTFGGIVLVLMILRIASAMEHERSLTFIDDNHHASIASQISHHEYNNNKPVYLHLPAPEKPQQQCLPPVDEYAKTLKLPISPEAMEKERRAYLGLNQEIPINNLRNDIHAVRNGNAIAEFNVPSNAEFGCPIRVAGVCTRERFLTEVLNQVHNNSSAELP